MRYWAKSHTAISSGQDSDQAGQESGALRDVASPLPGT